MISIFWLVPISAIASLLVAFYFFKQMMREDEGTPIMRKIAEYVRQGALAYLKQQYKVVSIVFLIISALLILLSFGFKLQNQWVPFAFLTGGFYSALAGFLGMKTATQASSRAAYATSLSLNRGLRLAFRSGAVMGLVVVGLALLDYSFWYLILTNCIEAISDKQRTLILANTMLTFGMGASLQALFARVGGGIFTKAADVGADLVGKVEAGIPEDDPRNPATIADNVGDNVGDVAGMGADLYESYYGAILAAASLGALAFDSYSCQLQATLAPALIGAVGVLLSICGIFSVRIKDDADCNSILKALSRGVNFSSLLIIVASLGLLKFLGIPNYLGIWGAIVVGIVAGVIIGKVTEIYTSQTHKPTRKVSEQSITGPATVIIAGLGVGMISTILPVLCVAVGTALAFGFATGFDFKNMDMGLYGVAVSAVGMLSTLGITLATDAYGPIADNAGGNAQMSNLPEEVRQKTDALDSIGNTTAASGKGFAIASAALTALALLAGYVQSIKMAMQADPVRYQNILIDGKVITDDSIGINEMMTFFQVHLVNPKVLMGLFIGSMVTFVFCGMALNAVGRAASKMVEEVRRQFKEIKGIMEGTGEPDYARCVAIATGAAQKEMIIPSLCAVIIPLLTGILIGIPGVIGLLAGTLSTGFVLAIFMANSGGSWDNAKKYIEEGNFGGKGSDSHKAAVIGDTVGDPFKDTAGPSLNILIKLMSTSSIVTVGLTLACHALG